MKTFFQKRWSLLTAILGAPTGRVRGFIVLSAILLCVYAFSVIVYVLTVPNIGVRCAFSLEVNRFFPDFLYPTDQKDFPQPQDKVIAVGEVTVHHWPQLVRHLASLRSRPPAPIVSNEAELQEPALTRVHFEGKELIRVHFERADGSRFAIWCRLGRSPVETLVPTILWFFIKAGLFVVGALVLWQRPQELSARLFFFLGVVSCGAYLGGYHWQSIVSSPSLLLVFMISSILLPTVSLHFYLAFPRPKTFLLARPWLSLVVLYGPSILFLLVLLNCYGAIRWLAGNAEAIDLLLQLMLRIIYGYFGFALFLYILSICCLIHSYRHAQDASERNQVKWILFGASAALMPLGYSLYLALLQQDKFSGGAATWPMFCASLCVTIAFTISITRYRLMQLDQLVSSGFVYVSFSVLAAVVYYGLVFGGVLLLGSQMDGPSLGQLLGVGITVLVLVVLLDLARNRLKRAMDRHFHREKILLDRTFHRMSEAVAQLVDPRTLATRLLRTTTDLLNASRGAVYLREGNPPLFRLADAVGAPPALTELPPGCPLLAELQRRGSLRSQAGVISPEARAAVRQLHFLGGDVAHALIHEEEILALLLLGPRVSGPYSEEDANLLAAFTQVANLALVSGEGARTIESLNRELQTKVEKIAEQQRRILALQSQLMLRQRSAPALPAPSPEDQPEVAPPQAPLADPPVSAEVVGSSPIVRQLLSMVRKVAHSSSAVLLRGESGTGKELLARAVHENSPRNQRPYVKVHCAALSPTLLESELFGHVKGSYTGAIRDRPGRFELADGGTLFLDEIGDVSWEVQTKLLRVLQEKTIERVGSSEPIQVDVRIIAATHQDLEKLIREGRFREDLFYRLNVLPIQVPPLRDRREDIPELVQHFLHVYGQRAGKGNIQMEDDVLTALRAAHWPGNIRELENVIERAVVLAEGTILCLEDLPAELLTGEREPASDESLSEGNFVTIDVQTERTERNRREREQLVRALAVTRGNKAEAARVLGMARSTLVSRLKKHGLS